MSRLHAGVTTIVLAGFMSIGLSACEKQGPAEKAGKAMDDAASKIADEANAAKQAVEEKVDE